MFLKFPIEKILAILAGISVLFGTGWCFWRVSAVPSAPPDRELLGGRYEATAVPVGRPRVTWEPPVAQSAGEEWIFEVFTPPTIHRDPGTGRIVAGIPGAKRKSVSEPGLKLVALHAAPYRIQLQGCFGLPGNEVATFVAMDTREVWCARPGERWAAQGLVLENLESGAGPADLSGGVTARARRPRAIVADEQTGRQVVLLAGESTLTDELLATIQTTSNSRGLHLREGESWSEGDVTYRIDRLSRDPAFAEISILQPARPSGGKQLLRLKTADVVDARPLTPPASSVAPPLSPNGP